MKTTHLVFLGLAACAPKIENKPSTIPMSVLYLDDIVILDEQLDEHGNVEIACRYTAMETKQGKPEYKSCKFYNVDEEGSQLSHEILTFNYRNGDYEQNLIYNPESDMLPPVLPDIPGLPPMRFSTRTKSGHRASRPKNSYTYWNEADRSLFVQTENGSHDTVEITYFNAAHEVSAHFSRIGGVRYRKSAYDCVDGDGGVLSFFFDDTEFYVAKYDEEGDVEQWRDNIEALYTFNDYVARDWGYSAPDTYDFDKAQASCIHTLPTKYLKQPIDKNLVWHSIEP